jgi:hypothetical protein
MSTQLELARSAKDHLSANNPALAVNILEKLAMELSGWEFHKKSDTELKNLVEEIGRLQKLAAQGTEFYSQWLNRVAPNGGSYTRYGSPTADVPEHGSGFRLGNNLRG